MIRSVLVPLDGSPFAEHALPQALTIARRAKADLKLVLVHVPLAAAFTEPFSGMEVPSDRPIKEHAQAYLRSVVERLKDAAPARVSVAVAEGPVVATLRDRIVAEGANLVVMTTHGRGPMGRLWLGSVADQLIREVSVPLLLVRPKNGKVDLGREVLLRHMLIPLDGSPLAEQAIEPAVAVGSLMEADYTLVKVLRPKLLPPLIEFVPPAPSEAMAGLLKDLDTLHKQELKDAGDYLMRMGQGLTARSLRAEVRVVTAEGVAPAILEEASAADIGCIAVATHGRGGLGRMVLGSVADKIIRGSTGLVLIVRPRSQ